MANDDDWDDVLGDRAQPTVSPDVVRKLLEMNPALRERGMTTNTAMNEMSEAQKKPASVGVAGKPATAKPSATADIFSAMKELRGRLDAGNQKLDAEMAKLKKAREELAAAMCNELTQWFIANDPSISSPVSQKVLAQEKAFLQTIGFSVDRYVDERMKKK